MSPRSQGIRVRYLGADNGARFAARRAPNGTLCGLPVKDART
jgi:hypothetical protein